MLGEEEKRDLINKLSDFIVKKGLSDIAVFILETIKPISFSASQFLVFLKPFVVIFLNSETYEKVIQLLEDRKNFELLIRAIEQKEAEL
jgi:hypothetical protein